METPTRAARKNREPSAAIKLSTFQKIAIWVEGYVRVGELRRPGWKRSEPLYAFKCPVHGYVANYPQGYGGALRCPHGS